MKILYRLRDAMCRFMYGRNGADQLSWAMIVLQLVLSLVSSLLRNALLSQIVYYFGLAIWVLVLFRLFSRNLVKRRAENARFMQWWGPKRGAFAAARARSKDTAHKYVKCGCGTYLRVPRSVGKVELTCPKCGKKRVVKT